MLAQGITFWLSRKQKSVALSSTEAEYMALSDCSCQLVWTSNLLSEIGFDIPVPHLYGPWITLLGHQPSTRKEVQTH